MLALAKSEAVATVKLNENEGMKESQPALQGERERPCVALTLVAPLPTGCAR